MSSPQLYAVAVPRARGVLPFGLARQPILRTRLQRQPRHVRLCVVPRHVDRGARGAAPVLVRRPIPATASAGHTRVPFRERDLVARQREGFDRDLAVRCLAVVAGTAVRPTPHAQYPARYRHHLGPLAAGLERVGKRALQPAALRREPLPKIPVLRAPALDELQFALRGIENRECGGVVLTAGSGRGQVTRRGIHRPGVRRSGVLHPRAPEPHHGRRLKAVFAPQRLRLVERGQRRRELGLARMEFRAHDQPVGGDAGRQLCHGRRDARHRERRDRSAEDTRPRAAQ